MPPEEVDLWHTVAQTCLIQDVYDVVKALYDVDITVPLGAGVMTGTNWSNEEAQKGEVVYEAPKELWIEAAKQEGML